jgi:hypothetical protein
VSDPQEISLDKALAAPGTQAPQKGEVSFEKAMGPDTRSGWKKDWSGAKKAISEALTWKDAGQMYANSSLSTIVDALSMYDDPQNLKEVVEEQRAKAAKSRAEDIAAGKDPDRGTVAKLKEIPGELGEFGGQMKKAPLTTGILTLKGLLYEAPTFAIAGSFKIPATVARVTANLTKSEKAIAAAKVVGGAAEGATAGALSEGGQAIAQRGDVKPGDLAKGAAQMATLDAAARGIGVGVKALGLLKKAKGIEEPRELVNQGGELAVPKKPEATFVGRGERTPWPPKGEPTTHEVVEARVLFPDDAEYGNFLNVHADELAHGEVVPKLEMATRDAHAATEELRKEVNGGGPKDISDAEVKDVLSTPPESRTAAQRALLKKWQMGGMLGAAGGGLLAYSLADDKTKNVMLAAGVMAATPMGKEHWEALKEAHAAGGKIDPADLPEAGKPHELETFQADMEKKYGVAWTQKMSEKDHAKWKAMGGGWQGEKFSPKPQRAATNHPLVATPEFRAWFRDSKMKDKDGNPLIFYHGTAQDISEFKPKQAGAIFVSPSPKFSGTFAEMSRSWMRANPEKVFSPQELRALEHAAVREKARKLKISEEQAAKQFPRGIRNSDEFRALAERHTRSGPNLMPVFVRAEKPWDYENPADVKAIRTELEKDFESDAEMNHLQYQLSHGDWEVIESPPVQAAIRKLGYDAFHMKETETKNLAVLDSRQIKSATGNSGAFAEVAHIGGSAQTEFLAVLAGAGLGALIGSQMDDESPIRDEIVGMLAGATLGRVGERKLSNLEPGAAGRMARGAADSMAPGKMKAAATKIAEKVPGGEKSSAPPERIRVKEAIDNHQTRMARTAREVMQVVHDALTKVPSLERRVEISRALDGEVVALSKPEREVFENIKGAFRKIGDDAVAAGVLDELRENYITHLVKPGQEAKVKKFLAQIKGGLSMNPASPYAKERTFKGFMSQMEKAGIELVSKDAAVIYSKYAFAMQRSIANAELLHALKNDSRGIFLPVGGKAKIPAEFVTVDRPMLLGVKVHPDIAPELKFLFDTRDPDGWVKMASVVSTAAKRAEVSFSMFHAVSLAQAYLGSQGKLKTAAAGAAVGAGVAAAAGGDPTQGALAGVGTAMAAPVLRDVVRFSRGQTDLLKQLRAGGVGDDVDKALKAGLKISMEKQRPVVTDVAQDFYTGMESLQAAMDKYVHPVAGKAVGVVIKANHAVDNWMWGRLHAGMKLEVWMDKKNKLIRDNVKAREGSPEVPLLSEERAGEIAASYANSLFGGMNWTKLMEGVESRYGREVASAMTSPTGMRYLNLLTFAPDWTASTTLSAVRAMDLRPSQAELAGLHRQYMVRAALWTLATAEAINYASSGHHLWENKDSTVVELGDGSTMQLSKHFYEPFHWLQKPRQEALNKLGALPAETIEQLTGDQYLSTKGAPKMKGGKEHLEHLGKRFLPFGVTGSPTGTLGIPIYPPKKPKKKKSADYLEDAQ